MKSLRLEKHWSQEHLAQLSGLNIRTIQRVEKGESVGVETLTSLASVFEITPQELAHVIQNDTSVSTRKEETAPEVAPKKGEMKANVRSLKYFYGFSAFLIAVFLIFMLPNYNDGENLAPLLTIFLCFCVLIAVLAIFVFQPFGQEWKRKDSPNQTSTKRD